MNSELSGECPSEVDLQTKHALDLTSENQWLRVLQSNRVLVSMTILNFYNDKRGSTSLNDDCAKWFLKRAWSQEQNELELNLVIKSLIYRDKAMIILLLVSP